jgi:hypothetical protein
VSEKDLHEINQCLTSNKILVVVDNIGIVENLKKFYNFLLARTSLV